MPLTTRTKVVLAVALSITVTGLMVTASLLRRRKRRKQPRRAVRPMTNVFANATLNHGPYVHQMTSSPKIPEQHQHQHMAILRPQSVSSTQARKASSISSLSSVSTLRCTGGTLTPTSTSDIVTVEGMFNHGIEAFEKAVRYWQTALHIQSQSLPETETQETSSTTLTSQLEKLVDAASGLQQEIDSTALKLSTCNCGDGTLDISHGSISSRERGTSLSYSLKSGSISDSDSFVSAAELEELSSIASGIDFFSGDESSQDLYDRALKVVREGGVQARRLRTKVLLCSSDEDFLAKLHCIRQATIILFQDKAVQDFFTDMGLQLTADLLWHANYDTEGFIKAYDAMIAYVKDADNWKDIEEELQGRKVRFLSFYDIVLDFFLLDAFDDLENPPSSIISVIQNRWLSSSVKETALATAVWSVLAAKTRMLQNPSGFLAKMYAISHHMTPALAWGFMGTNEELKEMMVYFKNQVLQFCRDIFSFKRCRYSSILELSEDIHLLAKEYGSIINHKLNATDTLPTAAVAL